MYMNVAVMQRACGHIHHHSGRAVTTV